MVILICYTVETSKLRKAAQLQNERSIMPIVTLEAASPHFSHSARQRGARTPACRVETYLDTVAGQQHSVESWRRQKCRRGTQECVRHTARLECV
jgi:hypothetical protein